MIAKVPANSFLSQLKNKARVFKNTLRNSLPPAEPIGDLGTSPAYCPVKSRKRSHSEGDSFNDVQKPLKAKKRKTYQKVEAEKEHFEVDKEYYQNVKEVKPQPTFKKSRKEFKTTREAREDESKRTLFLGNYPLSVKQDELKKLCTAFGDVTSIRFRNIFGSSNTMSKGVAARRKSYSDAITHCCVFVVFAENKSAAEAVKHFKGMKLGNRHLNASLASDKHGCSSKMSVFLNGLPSDSDEEEVRLAFRQYGPILTVKLIRDGQSGDCKGLGYVEFETIEGINLCLKVTDHFFRNKRIKVSKCFKKDKSKKSGKSQATFYAQDLSTNRPKRPPPGETKKKEQYVKSKTAAKADKKVPKKSSAKKHKSSLI